VLRSMLFPTPDFRIMMRAQAREIGVAPEVLGS
jgi:hypothetical protein